MLPFVIPWLLFVYTSSIPRSLVVGVFSHSAILTMPTL
jgi:hypothetical protein